MRTFQSPKRKSEIDFQQDGNLRLSAAVVFGLIFFSVVFLLQTNELVDKNFELRSLQKSLAEKKHINQQAAISLTEVRSVSSLEEAAKSLDLVPLDKIQYLKDTSDSLISSR